MKMLTHRTPTVDDLPVTLAQAKAHMRVDHDEDDTAIESMVATAAAELEQFAHIALLTQTIRVTIFDPDMGPSWLRLPIGPADENSPPSVLVDGVAFTDFAFAGGNRPVIRWGETWSELSEPTRVTIEYYAGFGDTAADVPPDLAQAVMDQAALHYDGRSPMSRRELTTSPHMARIGARYRGVQT
ncbi:MAG: head-tail connector protein [Maritimibacter sp.]|nr:head-tail connector protein [Maritimibacter sp.]